MWRRAVGAAPRDGRVETQERVDTLDRKVGAKRETFPWRGPAEIRHRASRRQLRLLYGERDKRKSKVLEERLKGICAFDAIPALERAAGG